MPRQLTLAPMSAQLWIVGLGMVWLLMGCASENGGGSVPTPPGWPTFAAPVSTGDSALDEWMQEELHRLHALLHPTRTRASLSEATPLLEAEALGALAAVGLTDSGSTLLVSVYLFESAAPHEAAREQLQQVAPQTGTYQLTATNGALFFFGYIRTAGPDDHSARSRLNSIVSAFAGDE